MGGKNERNTQRTKDKRTKETGKRTERKSKRKRKKHLNINRIQENRKRVFSMVKDNGRKKDIIGGKKNENYF